MKDFRLDYEFEPGVFVGCILVTVGNEQVWIRQPGMGGLELWTDGFVNLIPSGTGLMVDRFSRTASNMDCPVPCWTRSHVESFVLSTLLV